MNDSPVVNVTFSKRNTLTRIRSQFIRAGNTLGKVFSKKQTYVDTICALLIILFIYTGLNKMIDLDKFKFEMGRSPFIEKYSDLIAYTLPGIELIISILLIRNRTRLLGIYLSFALMAMFTGYIWLMLNYAHDLPCSCGGIISELSWKDHLVFNATFSVLAIVAGILHSKNIKNS